MARSQRSSFRPVSTTGRHHWSGALAGIVKGADWTTRSGAPRFSDNNHASSLGHLTGAGKSRLSPNGDPESIHLTIVSISPSLSDRSFLNCWIPIFLSRYHG